MTRRTVLMSLVLLLGCAAQQKQAPDPKVGQTAEAAKPQKLRCQMVRTSGSNIAEQVCFPVEGSESDRAAAKELLQRPPVQALGGG